MDKAEGKVGPFFFLDGQVLSDSIAWSKAEGYGEFRTWGSHDRFWDVLVKSGPNLQAVEYYSCPRGRINYHEPSDTFWIYLDPDLNTAAVLAQILREYGLTGKKILVDDTDLHYKIYSDDGFDALMAEELGPD